MTYAIIKNLLPLSPLAGVWKYENIHYDY